MVLGFLNIGTSEMVLIMVVALLLFGGKKLPELARGLGRGIREFKDASEDIKREISDQINSFEKEIKDVDVIVKDTPKSTTPAQAATVASTVVATTEEAEPVVANTEAVVAEAPVQEKKFPQFSAPEGTYQHDPGAHPIDQEEYYKYGYNDHFATDEDDSNKACVEGGADQVEKEKPSTDTETKQA